jgi:hypothetical protein
MLTGILAYVMANFFMMLLGLSEVVVGVKCVCRFDPFHYFLLPIKRKTIT